MRPMEDPPRLSEASDAPAGLRALLMGARQDGLERNEIARVVRGIESQISPAPPSSPTGMGFPWKSVASLKVGVVVLVGAGLGTGILSARSRNEETTRASEVPAVTASPSGVEESVKVAPRIELAEVAIGASAESLTPVRPSRHDRGGKGVHSVEKSNASESLADAGTLAEEHKILRAARAALGKNPQQALSLTKEHRRRFPQGTLAQEREVLAIEALSRMGRSEEANSRAKTFSAHYPNSPHRGRIQQSVGETK